MKKSTLMGLAAGLMMTTAISARAAMPAYTLDPADGATVTEFETVTLTFPDAEVYFNEGQSWDPDLLIVFNEQPKEFYCATPKRNDVAQGSSFTFNLSSDWEIPFSQPGTYRMTIKNMYQMVDGEKVDLGRITSNFSINIDLDITFSQPSNEATDLQGLEMYVKGNFGFAENNKDDAGLLNGGGKEYRCDKPKCVYDPDTDITTVTFTWTNFQDEDAIPTHISTPGTYKLTIKQWWLEGGPITQPMTFQFTVVNNGPELTYMRNATMLEPSNRYVGDFGFIHLSYAGVPLTLVNPSADENNAGFIYSTEPAALKIEGYETPFNLYPYVMTTLKGGNDPGLMPFAIDDDMETEDILVFDLDQLLEDFSWVLPSGRYTLTVPENIVKNALGAVNPEQQFSFIHMPTCDLGIVTPEEMDFDTWQPIKYKASELSKVEVDWGAVELFATGYNGEITIVKSGSNTVPTPLTTNDEEISFEDNKLQINLSNITPGTWEIYIPEGYFTIDGVKLNPEQLITYTIIPENAGEEGSTMEAATVVEPVSPYVTNIGALLISYEGGVPLTLTAPSTDENMAGFNYSTIPAAVEFEADGTSHDIYPYVMAMATGGVMPRDIDGDDVETEYVLILDVGDLLEQYDWVLPRGKVTITLPEGVVKNVVGAVNPAQQFEYNLMKGAPEPGELSPIDYDWDKWEPIEYTAEELSDITVDWGATSLVGTGYGYVTIQPGDTFSTPTPLGGEVNIVDNKLHINLSRMEAGNWMISIPEGYVIIDDEYINEEQNFTYFIIDKDTSGVVAIDADDEGLYRVYDLNGVNVLNATDADALRGLAKGLYIVNGHKVIIK